tara:strand:+ start:5412 stop:5522 length:111 start_codon:yes stop_codon:yes gene_type:complete
VVGIDALFPNACLNNSSREIENVGIEKIINKKKQST